MFGKERVSAEKGTVAVFNEAFPGQLTHGRNTTIPSEMFSFRFHASFWGGNPGMHGTLRLSGSPDIARGSVEKAPIRRCIEPRC